MAAWTCLLPDSAAAAWASLPDLLMAEPVVGVALGRLGDMLLLLSSSVFPVPEGGGGGGGRRELAVVCWSVCGMVWYCGVVLRSVFLGVPKHVFLCVQEHACFCVLLCGGDVCGGARVVVFALCGGVCGGVL